MLEINLRRLSYSSLFPKSNMGGLTHLFKVKLPSWSLLSPYAAELHGSAMNSFSLKKAVENSPLLTMLYMKELGKWDSMAYLTGENSQATIFNGLYDWLGCPPYVLPRTSEVTRISLLNREVDLRESYTFPLVEPLECTVYWVAYTRLYGYTRQVSMVGEDFSYTYRQLRDTDLQRWSTQWTVRSSTGGVEVSFPVLPRNYPIHNITKACLRHWAAERSSALIKGEESAALTINKADLGTQIFERFSGCNNADYVKLDM